MSDEFTPQETPDALRQSADLIEALERIDRLDGPVADLIRAWKCRLEAAPKNSFRNSILFFAVLLLVLGGLGTLTWYGKIDSNALMLLVGLILGLMSNHMKGIFGGSSM